MKRIATLSLVLLAGTALASIVVLFDPNSQPIPGRVVRVLHSANELEFLNNTNALVGVTAFPEGTFADWKVSNRVLHALSTADRATQAAWMQSNAVWDAAVERTNLLNAAAQFVDGLTPESRILRAFALLTLDQINTLRKQHSLAVITTNTFLAAMTNAVKADPR